MAGPAGFPAADVYAATATFFECVTGHKPFPGTNFAELAVQHVEAPVPETEAPEPVRPLIRRGLAKAPEQRPENAEAFVAELEEAALAGYGPDWEERGQRKLAALAALLPLLFPSAGAAAAGTTALATTVLPPAPAAWAPGRRGALAAAAVVVIGALLLFTYEAAAGESGGAATLSAFATSSPGPPGGGPGPGPGASGSASPTPSAPVAASPWVSVSPSPSLLPLPLGVGVGFAVRAAEPEHIAHAETDTDGAGSDGEAEPAGHHLRGHGHPADQPDHRAGDRLPRRAGRTGDGGTGVVPRKQPLGPELRGRHGLGACPGRYRRR
ncbi:hypothetical protein ACFSNO_06285 [Streptomyces cirratus]